MNDEKKIATVNKELPFLYKRPWYKLGFGKKQQVPPEKIKQPILLLMRENGHMDTIEGITEGLFRFRDKDKKTKAITITPNKAFGWAYGGQIIKTYIAYENEAFPYPTDITHDSTTMLRIIERIMMNYKGLS